ncbi:MAG TPA: transglycosylase domain-containing protein, partial [Myxococcota bacterium]
MSQRRLLTRARLGRALGAGVAIALLACAAFIALPLPSALLDRRAVSSLVIVDAHGDALLESAAPDGAAGRSTPLVHDAVPPLVAAAFVAAEDQRFFQHAGVDVRAMFR